MILNFKNDLFFIKMLNILKEIARENKLINYRNIKRPLIVKNFLKVVTRAPSSVPNVINYAISYVRLIYVVL